MISSFFEVKFNSTIKLDLSTIIISASYVVLYSQLVRSISFEINFYLLNLQYKKYISYVPWVNVVHGIYISPDMIVT